VTYRRSLYLDNLPVFYIHLYSILCSQLEDIQLKSYRKYNILNGKIKILHWKVRIYTSCYPTAIIWYHNTITIDYNQLTTLTVLFLTATCILDIARWTRVWCVTREVSSTSTKRTWVGAVGERG